MNDVESQFWLEHRPFSGGQSSATFASFRKTMTHSDYANAAIHIRGTPVTPKSLRPPTSGTSR